MNSFRRGNLDDKRDGGAAQLSPAAAASPFAGRRGYFFSASSSASIFVAIVLSVSAMMDGSL